MKVGEYIVPSPKNVADLIHSTALSMKQLLNDTQLDWGPVEWAEYHNLLRAKMALTPEDWQLIQFVHSINLAWNQVKMEAMKK